MSFNIEYYKKINKEIYEIKNFIKENEANFKSKEGGEKLFLESLKTLWFIENRLTLINTTEELPSFFLEAFDNNLSQLRQDLNEFLVNIKHSTQALNNILANGPQANRLSHQAGIIYGRLQFLLREILVFPIKTLPEDEQILKINAKVLEQLKKVNEVAKEVANKIPEFEKTIIDYENRLEKREEEYRKLVGAASDKQHSGYYGGAFTIERRDAEILRWVAIAIMLSGIVTIGGLLAEMLYHQNLSWLGLIMRISIGLIFFIPAFYCINESSKQRKQANKYKDIELQLSALGPYLSECDPNDAKKERKELAKKYFVGAENCEPTLDPLIKQLTKMVEIFDKADVQISKQDK